MKQAMAQSLEEWLTTYLTRQGIDPSTATDRAIVQAARHIPCSIRCWRIGQPVEVKEGEPCPECGKPYEGDNLPLRDVDRILQDDWPVI
jgi:hypothetical protein